MMFKLYSSVCRENSSNCSYPNSIDVVDEAALASAVSHDYVGAKYKGNYRKKENFEESNCLIMDCDNNHTDNPDEWVSISTLKRDFPEVTFAIHYSRNNMKPKDGKTARPKFHVFFPIDNVNNSDKYSDMKEQVLMIAPYFDNKVKDAARFFFGTENPKVEIVSGTKNLTQFLSRRQTSETEHIIPSEAQVIHQGERNDKMLRTAERILKQLGNTLESKKKFLDEANNCKPPLEQSELSQIWTNACKFYEEVISKQNNSSSLSDLKLKPEDYTDVGQAKVFAREYVNVLRYSEATKFIKYNGSYWDSEGADLQALKLATELTDRQKEEVNREIENIKSEMNENKALDILIQRGEKKAYEYLTDKQKPSFQKYQQARAYEDYIKHRRYSNLLQSTLNVAKPELMINPKELDKNDFYLNTPSATYDLSKGLSGSMDHNYSDYITKQTATDVSEEGRDEWERALLTFFCGDWDLINYVQEIVGLVAIGKVFNETLIIAYGNGCNGKSTFWNTIHKVLGTYSGNISSDVLLSDCKRNIKPEMASARGKRLLIASEMERGKKFSTSLLKQLCSTDQIVGEEKYKAPLSFIPSHTLVLYTNHLPKIDEDDNGTWRRLTLIPFNAKISASDDKKNYADYLFKHSGGAILSWIIEGAERIISKDYKTEEPQIVKKAKSQYQEDNDWLANFMNDCCSIDSNYMVLSTKIYEKYCQYCSQINETPRRQKEFNAALKNKGFTIKKHRLQNEQHIMVFGLQINS